MFCGSGGGMSTLNINNLSLNYGAKALFKDVFLTLCYGKRYGVVGANGVGKSTLLRLIAGIEHAVQGSISVPKDAQIGWLKQDLCQYEGMRVIDVVIFGNKNLWSALKSKEQLLLKADFSYEDGVELSNIEEKIVQENGYQADAQAQRLLTGLGIGEQAHYKMLAELSGGLKLRTLLAQVLFACPDILLLDEPTNHLDISSTIWLTKFLQTSYQGLLLVVSHDRDLINLVSTDILDIDYETITLYAGDYDFFIKEKLLENAQREREIKGQQKQLAHMQQFVDRFGAKASKARQAQSKLKQMSKINLVDMRTSSRISPNFNFDINRPPGKKVLDVKDISKSFSQQEVLIKVGFSVHRGEKIGIIGANGLGKSTLLKILLGALPADDGSYEWGYETHLSYFAQDHHEQLTGEQSAYQWLTANVAQKTSSQIRKMLGKVLFSGDDANKSILTLSGGEAARLLLARIMLDNSNVLILDEPTNHLDLEAIQSLENALVNYQGTLIFTSHDRHFVSNVANRIIALTEFGIRDHNGNFSSYLELYQDEIFHDDIAAKEAKKPNTNKDKKSDRKFSDKYKQDLITKIQQKIEQLEQQLQQIDNKFLQGDFFSSNSPQEVSSLQAERTKIQDAIDKELEHWATLEDKHN